MAAAATISGRPGQASATSPRAPASTVSFMTARASRTPRSTSSPPSGRESTPSARIAEPAAPALTSDSSNSWTRKVVIQIPTSTASPKVAMCTSPRVHTFRLRTASVSGAAAGDGRMRGGQREPCHRRQRDQPGRDHERAAPAQMAGQERDQVERGAAAELDESPVEPEGPVDTGRGHDQRRVAHAGDERQPAAEAAHHLDEHEVREITRVAQREIAREDGGEPGGAHAGGPEAVAQHAGGDARDREGDEERGGEQAGLDGTEAQLRHQQRNDRRVVGVVGGRRPSQQARGGQADRHRYGAKEPKYGMVTIFVRGVTFFISFTHRSRLAGSP